MPDEEPLRGCSEASPPTLRRQQDADHPDAIAADTSVGVLPHDPPKRLFFLVDNGEVVRVLVEKPVSLPPLPEHARGAVAGPLERRRELRVSGESREKVEVLLSKGPQQNL